MNLYENIFPSGKAVIGMIHIPALPGTPGGQTATFNALTKFALTELETLQNGGVDGVIVENFWDTPYYPNRVPSLTIAAMAAIIGQVISKASVPVGVNILYNDFKAEIAIARAVGAGFIRAEVFVDPSLSETGLIEPSAAQLVRERELIRAEEVAIFADVQGKNTTPLWQRPLSESALDAEQRGHADAIIITGAGTGRPVSIQELKDLRAVVSIPLIIGSGVTSESVPELLQHCDGAIVGSYFKTNGKIDQPTDLDRVRNLIRAVKG